jgi:hypothetical protein
LIVVAGRKHRLQDDIYAAYGGLEEEQRAKERETLEELQKERSENERRIMEESELRLNLKKEKEAIEELKRQQQEKRLQLGYTLIVKLNVVLFSIAVLRT